MVNNLFTNTGTGRNGYSVTGLSRSPGGGNGNPLWYSCLENSMDREAWQPTVHGVAKSNTTPFKFLFHSGPYFLLYIQDLYLAIIFCVLYFYWNIIDVKYYLSFRCAT